jgi:hypothetical protein
MVQHTSERWSMLPGLRKVVPFDARGGYEYDTSGGGDIGSRAATLKTVEAGAIRRRR